MTRPLIVIGAGIAGLVRAWSAMRAGRDVIVLEAGDRAGGTIRTHTADGMVLEGGPQSLRSGAAATWSVVRDLGLADRVVLASPAARSRFVLWNGRLRPVPMALLDRSFLPRRALLRLLAEPLVRAKGPPDEDVAAFATRRFGPAVAERLVDPVVAGICGGDARDLDAAALLPAMTAWERDFGGVLRGAFRAPRGGSGDAPKALWTLSGGLEALPRALAAALGDRIRLSAPVTRIERIGAGFRVHTEGGSFEAGDVAVCVPPPVAAKILPDLADGLNTIRSALVAAIHLAWRPEDVPRRWFRAAMPGFGWLAPALERRDALGCLWVSSVFPGHAPGRALLRVMVGGARDPGLDRSPDALVDRARRVLAEVQGIRAEPLLARADIAEIPQYPRGHAARIAEMNAAIPGLRLIGWGYTGVGVEHGASAALEPSQDRL